MNAIPLQRLASVELRKMFDTRSGFWLLIAIAASAVLATGAVTIFGHTGDLTYSNFGAAIGVPMTVLLPIMAALSVTGEWSQRTGLTTFTLVPDRRRVILVKAYCAVVVGVASIVVALAIGALGNLIGAAARGVTPVWDLSLGHCAFIVLGNVLGLLTGFALGTVIRNSAGAVTGWFVLAFVLPPLSELLARSAGWYSSARPWVDTNEARNALFDGSLTAPQWAHLGVTSLVWLVVPLAAGLRLVLRTEIK